MPNLPEGTNYDDLSERHRNLYDRMEDFESRSKRWQKAFENIQAKTTIRLIRLLPESWGIESVF